MRTGQETKLPRRERISREQKLREKHIQLALDQLRRCLQNEQNEANKALLTGAIREVCKIWSI